MFYLFCSSSISWKELITITVFIYLFVYFSCLLNLSKFWRAQLVWIDCRENVLSHLIWSQLNRLWKPLFSVWQKKYNDTLRSVKKNFNSILSPEQSRKLARNTGSLYSDNTGKRRIYCTWSTFPLISREKNWFAYYSTN